MFISLMSPERIARISQLSTETWNDYARKWTKSGSVMLYGEICEMLTRVACAWAEVPLAKSEVAERALQLKATFDYAGSVGPKHYWARIARKRAERWIERVIEKCRAGQLSVADDSAAHIIASHRELNGELLYLNVAAVELLNVLRPIVAVSVFITFAALALHKYPACRQTMRSDVNDYAHLFAQELRRFYPFFPAVGAEVRHDFEWNGYHFPKAVPVLLDLYGTNHDERAWKFPDEFQPERFHNWDQNPYTFIPQGGGDQHVHHRCPGELIAIELLKVASMFLAGQITYDVSHQDLEIDFMRVPALPRSQFIISNVRVAAS